MTSNSRSRGWVYTLNNWTDEQWEALREITCRYHVIGKEVGECGTPHLQAYIHFAEACTFRSIKKKLFTAHIEKLHGSPEDAANYCKKGEQPKDEWKELKHRGPNWGLNADFWETGELPHQGKRNDWEAIREMSKSGCTRKDLVDQHFKKVCMYPGILRNLEILRPALTDRATLANYWYYGAPGLGKTSKARRENPGLYQKLKNKWWDHYDGQEVVLIDEWRPDDSSMVDELNRWADHYPMQVETKGGMMEIRPQKIIVTSNYSIEECFQSLGQVTLDSVKRRFKVVHFVGLNQYHEES